MVKTLKQKKVTLEPSTKAQPRVKSNSFIDMSITARVVVPVMANSTHPWEPSFLSQRATTETCEPKKISELYRSVEPILCQKDQRALLRFNNLHKVYSFLHTID